MNARFSRLLQFFGISIDFLVLNSVYWMARHMMSENLDHKNLEYLNFWICLNAFWLIVSWLTNLYSEKKMASFEVFTRSSMHVYVYWLIIILIYLFFARQFDLSRIFILVVLVSYGIMLLSNRFLFLLTRTYLRQKHLLTRKVLIVGYNETAKRLTEYLEDEDNFTEIVGYCEKEENVTELTHYPIVSNLDNIMQISLQKGVEEIYSTIAPEQNFNIHQLMKLTDQACIRFRVIPDLTYFIDKRPFHVEFLKDIPVLTFRREPLEDSSQRLKKRFLDIVVSLFVIVFILSWLLPILALLIYIESPGPVFFKQLRSGRNNKAFNCLKFRSMKINGDANLKQASKNDQRITRIGRFIRKTSLDEFPQFINVIRGEMSLVGPRPHMLKHTDDYSQLDQYMVRHFAKPGITGWAQVNGYRGETRDIEQMIGRVEHDIWYLENWSLWLDVKIIFLTGFNIIRGEKNAF